MRSLRCAFAMILIAVAVISAALDAPSFLFTTTLLAFLLRVILWRGLMRALRPTIPIVLFAGVLAGMQWISQGTVTSLPLKTVAVFLLSTAAFRVLPWDEMSSAIQPGSALFASLLFALFLGHFAAIFAVESRRVLQARALRVSHPWGRVAFRSLGAAVAAVVRRSMDRAETFYAAQSLRGLAE